MFEREILQVKDERFERLGIGHHALAENGKSEIGLDGDARVRANLASEASPFKCGAKSRQITLIEALG